MCVFPSHRCFSGLRARPRPADTRETWRRRPLRFRQACASLAAPQHASLPAPSPRPGPGSASTSAQPGSSSWSGRRAEPKPACGPLRPGPGTSAPQRKQRHANHSPDTVEARLMGVMGSQRSSRESTCLPCVWKLPALKLRAWRAAR